MARKFWRILFPWLLILTCQAECCVEQIPQSEQAKRLTREYIIFNYRTIANEILNGSGGYLDALFASLNICPAQHASAVVKLRRHLSEQRHPASFAIAVVSELSSGTSFQP